MLGEAKKQKLPKQQKEQPTPCCIAAKKIQLDSKNQHPLPSTPQILLEDLFFISKKYIILETCYKPGSICPRK
jgi:hypothetical protein